MSWVGFILPSRFDKVRGAVPTNPDFVFLDFSCDHLELFAEGAHDELVELVLVLDRDVHSSFI